VTSKGSQDLDHIVELSAIPISSEFKVKNISVCFSTSSLYSSISKIKLWKVDDGAFAKLLTSTSLDANVDSTTPICYSTVVNPPQPANGAFVLQLEWSTADNSVDTLTLGAVKFELVAPSEESSNQESDSATGIFVSFAMTLLCAIFAIVM